MKIYKKLVVVLTILLVFVSGSEMAFAAEPVRYIDDIVTECDVTYDIAFSDVQDYAGTMQTLKLDVYEPANDTETDRPVIIWVHGGSLQFGNKADNASMGYDFAKKGFVYVSIDYRLNPNPYTDNETFRTTMTNAATDIASAVQWVRNNSKDYGMDAERIIIGGYSAGAELVENLYYYDSYVPDFDRSGIRACIALSGNRLFYPAPEDEVSSIGDPDTKCLVIHGKNDTVNPVSDVEKFAVQIGDRGVFKYMDGYNHYWVGEDAAKLINTTIIDFLSEYVTFAVKAEDTTQETTSVKENSSAPKTGEGDMMWGLPAFYLGIFMLVSAAMVVYLPRKKSISIDR